MPRRRAAKKKQRQRARVASTSEKGAPEVGSGAPSSPGAPASIVVKRGRVGPSCRLLVRDWRQVVGPRVAAKLKESRTNKVRDFQSVASCLGVSHLQLLTQTDHGLYLKIARLPSGPTITFQVLSFSLIGDVQRSVSGARLDPKDLRTPPVLVLSSSSSSSSSSSNSSSSNSSSEGLRSVQALQLATSMLRSVFAPVDVRTSKLSDFRRVAFFRRVPAASSSNSSSSKGEEEGLVFQFRHYSVSLKAAKLTAGVESVLRAAAGGAAQKQLLQQLQQQQQTDACDLLLAAEQQPQQQQQVRFDVAACPARLSKRSSLQLLLPGKQQQQQQQQQEELSMAVQLREIGPRLQLKLIKIEDDVCTGKVLYHALIAKTPEELRVLKKKEQMLKAKREEERQKLLELMKPKAAGAAAAARAAAAAAADQQVKARKRLRDSSPNDVSQGEGGRCKPPSKLPNSKRDHPSQDDSASAAAAPAAAAVASKAAAATAPGSRPAPVTQKQQNHGHWDARRQQAGTTHTSSTAAKPAAAKPEAARPATAAAAAGKEQHRSSSSNSSRWRGSNKSRLLSERAE
ncbi:hypothetical protein Esti_001480 [Eimeria stiedai]